MACAGSLVSLMVRRQPVTGTIDRLRYCMGNGQVPPIWSKIVLCSARCCGCPLCTTASADDSAWVLQYATLRSLAKEAYVWRIRLPKGGSASTQMFILSRRATAEAAWLPGLVRHLISRYENDSFLALSLTFLLDQVVNDRTAQPRPSSPRDSCPRTPLTVV